MKKIKIMLMVITVLAAVGGVFAFKAKKTGTYYCTVAFNSACPTVVGTTATPLQGTGTEDGSGSVCYTTTAGSASDCSLTIIGVRGDFSVGD